LCGCGKRSKRYTRRSPCSARIRTGSSMGWPGRLPLHNLKEPEPLASHGVWSAIHVHGSPPFGMQPDQDSDHALPQRTKRKQSKLPSLSSTWKLRLDMVGRTDHECLELPLAGAKPPRETPPEVQQLEGWKAPQKLRVRLRDTAAGPRSMIFDDGKLAALLRSPYTSTEGSVGPSIDQHRLFLADEMTTAKSSQSSIAP
jgi:hypothetical protein